MSPKTDADYLREVAALIHHSPTNPIRQKVQAIADSLDRLNEDRRRLRTRIEQVYAKCPAEFHNR